jgi:hypothetical protein
MEDDIRQKQPQSTVFVAGRLVPMLELQTTSGVLRPCASPRFDPALSRSTCQTLTTLHNIGGASRSPTK